MNKPEFLQWVTNPARIYSELSDQITRMGIWDEKTPLSTMDDLRKILSEYAEGQPEDWTVPTDQIPADWTPSAPALPMREEIHEETRTTDTVRSEAPVTPPPAREIVRHEGTTFDPLRGIAVVAILAIAGLALWAWHPWTYLGNKAQVSVSASATATSSVATATPGTTDTNNGNGNPADPKLMAGLSNKPSDLEPLPRVLITSAPLGQWIHPIYKSSTYQSSGGKDGQWSWAHTVYLAQANGGQFRQFEGNDGAFTFRHSDVHADVSFAVLTTSKWKSQFMEGNTSAPFGLNVRALPGTMITVYGENGKVLGSQAASRAGDLTIILPDDGATGISLSEDDPPKTFEVKIWVGPYDRSEGINTFDARKR